MLFVRLYPIFYAFHSQYNFCIYLIKAEFEGKHKTQ